MDTKKCARCDTEYDAAYDGCPSCAKAAMVAPAQPAPPAAAATPAPDWSGLIVVLVWVAFSMFFLGGSPLNTVLGLVLVIGSTIWVYSDAKKAGIRSGLTTGLANMGPVAWAVCTLLLWGIALPVYTYNRPRLAQLAKEAAGAGA